MKFQESRILHSRKNNPEHVFKSTQATSFSAQATLLLVIFSQDDSDFKSVNKAMLEELLKFERFPQGYKPNEERNIDVILEGSTANDIRLEFVQSFEETITKDLTTMDKADIGKDKEGSNDDSSSSSSAGRTTFASMSLTIWFSSMFTTVLFFVTIVCM